MSQVTKEDAYEAFDYIVNTRSTYELLSEAVLMLERRSRKARRSPLEELRSPLSFSTLKASWKGWGTMAAFAVESARRDYEKSFPEEAKGRARPAWVRGIDPADVLHVALLHRDRFPGG
jgi:hypothetical protein